MKRFTAQRARAFLATIAASLVAAACVSEPASVPSEEETGPTSMGWVPETGPNTANAELDTGPTLTVATYNVNFGLAGDADTVAAIEALGADVVFLQETNEAWEVALRGRAKQYPHRSFKHCCRAGGLAVLSKTPFAEKDYVHPEGAWFPAWRIVLNTPLGKLQVVNVHLRPNISDGGSVVSGLFTTPKIRQQEIAHYIATLDATLPTVFVGDFNETADGLAIQELNALGMHSALPVVGGPQNTWQWQTSIGKIRKQFDHIVYGNGLAVVSAEVRYEGRSDHFPVVATLRSKPLPPAIHSIPPGYVPTSPRSFPGTVPTSRK